MSERRVTVPDIRAAKGRPEPLAVLTAYDAPTARLLDEAGVDILLVGDSVGMVVAGLESTLPVTLDEMIYHTRAVCRGRRRALVVTDLPFLSFQVSVEEAVRNAGRVVKEGGADAVKLEGGVAVTSQVRALVAAGIPVMGHVGLTPQAVRRMGGYRVQGRDPATRAAILEDARALEAAGVFSIVVEGVPRSLGTEVTRAVAVPTIGIGAGPDCDGQVLVLHDLIGLSPAPQPPKFVRRYAEVGEAIRRAAAAYVADVRGRRFPSADESYEG
ncbi:MAG TPA: 3-methyl-2-oxobutanoate hydroxymethyltransferase [Thermodesulfobacteriota bacterium]|nr:3-methyl-2-oxobutanoate hydroxymethyltransferase [Thermodesulfobacteriota bacterium]